MRITQAPCNSRNTCNIRNIHTKVQQDWANRFYHPANFKSFDKRKLNDFSDLPINQKFLHNTAVLQLLRKIWLSCINSSFRACRASLGEKQLRCVTDHRCYRPMYSLAFQYRSPKRSWCVHLKNILHWISQLPNKIQSWWYLSQNAGILERSVKTFQVEAIMGILRVTA